MPLYFVSHTPRRQLNHLLRAGVVDFVLKSFRSNQLLNAVARCLDRVRLQRENHVLRYELKSSADQFLLRDKLIGSSNAIQHVRETIARVAPPPTSALLTGNSGTGKEVAARSLHFLSNRADKLFVPINCGAIPADVIEGELFGHLKGAFTGADTLRQGLFMHAQGERYSSMKSASCLTPCRASFCACWRSGGFGRPGRNESSSSTSVFSSPPTRICSDASRRACSGQTSTFASTS